MWVIFPYVSQFCIVVFAASHFKNSDTLIQAGIAKSDFDKSDVINNIKFFYETISKERPSGVKGDFVKKVSISPTMGPGININLDSFGA